MANMKDLAKAAGVSLATISRVFNNSEQVTAKTKEHVLKVAKELNFRPNKMAAALRKGRNSSIGVVVPDINREVFSAAIKSMEEVFSQSGYNIIICQTQESYEKEKKVIENLKQLRVSGIIISISKETKKINHLASLKDEGIPIIFFDRSLELGIVNSVVINNYNGAYQATNHLIEQGCRNIIHLAGREEVTIFRERRRGFKAALEDNAINTNADTILPFDDGHAEGVSLLKKLLSSNKKPDGILANGDIAALVAIRVINEMAIKVPEEIAIIGFGDSNFCEYLKPSLSSVNQRNEDVGKLAASILLDEIVGKKLHQLASHQMLPPILKIRQSSKRKA